MSGFATAVVIGSGISDGVGVCSVADATGMHSLGVVMVGWILRRRWWITGGAVLVVAGLVTATVLWPSDGRQGLPIPPSRARTYTAFDACLLTDAQGLASAPAAQVWAGMQKASLATHAKVSYLAVTGPDTVADASIFMNTLIVRNCDLFLAVGANEVRAALSAAQAYPDRHFVVVGAGSAAGNVAAVPDGSDVAGRVASAVQSATSGGFSGGVVPSGS